MSKFFHDEKTLKYIKKIILISSTCFGDFFKTNVPEHLRF